MSLRKVAPWIVVLVVLAALAVFGITWLPSREVPMSFGNNGNGAATVWIDGIQVRCLPDSTSNCRVLISTNKAHTITARSAEHDRFMTPPITFVVRNTLAKQSLEHPLVAYVACAHESNTLGLDCGIFGAKWSSPGAAQEFK